MYILAIQLCSAEYFTLLIELSQMIRKIVVCMYVFLCLFLDGILEEEEKMCDRSIN